MKAPPLIGRRCLSAVLLCFCVTGIFQGCATIVHGTRQDIGLSSSPSDATVYVDNKLIGETPLVVDMARRSHHVVRIELDGYEPFAATITSSVSGWVVGNLVFGGVIGLVVDASTGGMYCLSPDQIHAILIKQGTTMTEKEGALYCSKVLQAEQDWKKIGEMKPIKKI